MPIRSALRSPPLLTIPALLLLALPWSTARAAPAADSKAQARIHFDQGVQLYRDGDFPAAAIEFRRAYNTEPNYRVLYNLGQACAEGKDYACALSSFTSYLEQGGAEIAASRQAQLQQQIEKLRLRTGRLTIKTNVDGASVTIDDVAVGKSPLAAPVLVSSGRRKVALISPSGALQTRAVEVAGGDDLTTEVLFPAATYGEIRTILDASKDAPMEPGGDAHPDSGPFTHSRKAAIVIPAVLTGALILGATITGLQALDSKRQFEDAVNNLPGDSDTIEHERVRTRNWALASDLMTGGAIVGGVVTVIAILNYRSASSETALTAPPPRTSLSFGLNSFAFITRF